MFFVIKRGCFRSKCTTFTYGFCYVYLRQVNSPRIAMVSTTILMHCLTGKSADADPTFFASLINTITSFLSQTSDISLDRLIHYLSNSMHQVYEKRKEDTQHSLTNEYPYISLCQTVTGTDFRPLVIIIKNDNVPPRGFRWTFFLVI